MTFIDEVERVSTTPEVTYEGLLKVIAGMVGMGADDAAPVLVVEADLD